ncbi:sigma-54-dependent Fis family transcriptional regulator [Acinetobacter qingfengensis]|uniref:Sigma-54-dependent Fis family transcriptional regulator n=1 Tax=Acinetobacter qingfengensis TaxID=1262585 RepID=A0A1E7R1G8_9GAMM|nr:sigma-54 dependent transcriptional regulator [Acinetobacter qingfengensis]KAA8733220.1 sigma-54-dependent Fis family transcriptional regulator [Acinetobacter qingfengensis]OEY93146.1 sigma-54-dependent Fis family transcriptional regulator [Acinetobacter qingfengensis]
MTIYENLPALIVDDEEDLRILMTMTLKRLGVQCITAENLQHAQHLLAKHQFSICLTDLNLPDGNGIDLVQHIQQHYTGLPVAVISAYGNMDVAISALKAGAFDFVSKPIQKAQLKALLEHALDVGHHPITALDLQIEDQTLIGQSAVMQQLKRTLHKLARSQAPVYISGESGTGKEVVARLIHQLSNRNQGPFVPVNCGAIPQELMESEFFGHKKGSFTGAHQDKIGLFQAAHTGTLFLDEVADLPLTMQVKLLRAIQEKKIRPIGSDQEIAVDIRILSATHKNLEQLIQDGKFRQDLYFRIHVIDILIPPLRERGQDIIILAEHFLQQICADWQLEGLYLTEQAKQHLLNGYYEGNVRELRNIMERAVTLCDRQLIDIEHLQVTKPQISNIPQTPFNSASPNTLSIQSAAEKTPLPKEGLEEYLANIEKQLLIQALDSTHWNRTLAAKKLGMSFRSLRYRLKKFGLDDEEL